MGRRGCLVHGITSSPQPPHCPRPTPTGFVGYSLACGSVRSMRQTHQVPHPTVAGQSWKHDTPSCSLVWFLPLMSHSSKLPHCARRLLNATIKGGTALSPTLNSQPASLAPDNRLCNSTDWNFCAKHVQGTIAKCSSIGEASGECRFALHLLPWLV